jgi:hypothetical protein
MTHGFSHGRDLKFLTNNLFDSTPVSLPSLPTPIEDLLPVEFAAASKTDLLWPSDPDLIRFSTRDSDLRRESECVQFLTLCFQAPDLASFNHKAREVKDTTDYIWNTLLLASATIAGEICRNMCRFQLYGFEKDTSKTYSLDFEFLWHVFSQTKV